MVRENLGVDTSFDPFIYSENAIFNFLVTVSTYQETIKETERASPIYTLFHR